MAAMAPALTDAPAEARHIRLKLAAESNGNSTNLLLSSSISPSDTAGTNGKPHHEDNCCHCCNGKEPLSEPRSLGKLQPLVASYLCSHVGPVAEEGVLIKQSVLKNRGLLNGDLLLRTQLSGGQPKSFVNGGGAGTGTGGGNAMVPVNGLAKKAAVPSTALPEKGSVAPLNGDNAKPPTGAGALLPLSSKSGDVMATISVPRADSKHLRELGDLHSRAPEDTGVNGSSENPQIKSETPPSDRSHVGRTGALPETINNSTPLDAPQSSALCQRSCSPSFPSSGVEALVLRERAQQSQRRQVDVSARLQRLCKRLQVVQAKQVERHVKQQLTGFLHHTLSQSSSSRRDSIAQLLKDGSLPPELEKLHLSGTTSLRVAEAQFDSDATESSSGGESDIEEEELARVDTEQRHVKLWRRAEGRFALERASIISRWTWLQAHISDLEYRIRQHTDIYRQIRTSKGSVELGDSSSSHQTRTEKPKPQSAAGDFGPTHRFPIDRSLNEFFHSMAEASDVKLSPTPESGCSAARVRPLISWKRRRLVQPGTLQNLNSKVQRVCSPATPCDVNSACVMCGGGQLHPKAELQFERPLVDNVAVQDPGVHPTLSLQSDIPVSIQLQRMLKSHWQSRHMEKARPLKKLSLKHKLPHYSSSSSSSSSALSKHKFRLSNSPMAAISRFSSHKNRSERTRKQVEAGIRLTKVDAHTPCRTGRLIDRSLSRKRVRETSLDRTESPKLQFDAGSPYPPSQSSVQPSTPSTASRQMCLPSDSSTPLGPSSQTGSCSMPMRKRRSENSFDINNIVIPMSVAATTRVEKLQYKEIITPSWRELGAFPQHLAAEDENVEVEDLSDAACMMRHQKCEDQERNRWRWTALTPAKRRGSRSYKSVDGRTTPSLIGTNPSTPQPSSPDTGHFHLLQDYGPIPSPLSPPSPDTPCSRDAHTPSSRDSYTPHTRDAHRPVYSEDTRCSTPDCTYEERTVQPWEHRIFPLSEDPVLEPKEDPQPHQRFSCGAESESETSSA